jgi:hypothetical protein
MSGNDGPISEEDCAEASRDGDGGRALNYDGVSERQVEQSQYQDECKTGESEWCPGGAAGLHTWAAGGIIAAGYTSYAITEGVAYDITYKLLWKATWQMTYFCLQIEPCKKLITNGGDLTVLGRTPKYTEVAERLGADHLTVSASEWTIQMNDSYISQTQGTVFNTNNYLSSPGTVFYREVMQLLDRGFTSFMNILLFPPGR